MAVKIRLARKGRKKKAFYHVVVADSRSPRDGRYIEKIGSYNPITDPATIELDFDKALYWMQNGAQPTDTCKAILSYKGVLLKKHLLEGVKKGAFDEAEAEKRFTEWVGQNEAKIEAKKSKLEVAEETDKKKRIEAEKKINEKRAADIAKKLADLVAKEEAELKAKSAPAAAEAEESVPEDNAVTSESNPEVTPGETPQE
jgi:small subunit ribosomal protein S16